MREKSHLHSTLYLLVLLAIKGLKNTKAESVDGIQTEVWKKAVVVVEGPLAFICNLTPLFFY